MVRTTPTAACAPEAALVGAKRAVVLDAEAGLDVAAAVVALPDDAELDDALGDLDDLEQTLIWRVRSGTAGRQRTLGVVLEQRSETALDLVERWARQRASMAVHAPCWNSGSSGGAIVEQRAIDRAVSGSRAEGGRKTC